MNTKKILSITTLGACVISLAAWVTPADYFTAITENAWIQSLKTKTTAFNEHNPEDRVYVQLDKPFYKPGETMWLSTYVRDGISMKPSQTSDIVYVELISPRGNVEKTIKLIAKNGVAAGDFHIDSEANGGLYKIKAYTNWQKNDPTFTAFEKEVQVQNVVLPNLKMKLDFEKKAFGAGDEVVAKLELNTNENKPLTDHKVKYVVNIAGKKITGAEAQTDEEGIKYLRFRLPADLKSADGLLNVLIDYQGITESVSRSIPIVLNKIKFQSFPEGGDLVYGLESRVAFRALNEFDKPADVEGVVVTANGSKVAVFNSFHNGMGAFKFTPIKGETYSIRITRPEGIKEQFALPEPFEKGYVMNIDNSKQGEITCNVATTEEEELSLVAQVRGNIVYATAFAPSMGSARICFPTKAMPAGVAQITLFDANGIERAERLAFINKHQQLNVSITTDKEKYLPREKVKMNIMVKDEKGLPMPAHLSLSVVNDQLLSFADDKQGNILSQLLLQSDLKEKVEEPAFYFDENEPKSDKALDYLLMTNGWRRFTWEQVTNEQYAAINFPGEQAIVQGIVYDAYTYEPMRNATIKVNNKGMEYKTDSTGHFVLNKIDLSEHSSLNISANNYYGQNYPLYDYNRNTTVYLYPQQKTQNITSRSKTKSKKLDRQGFARADAPAKANRVQVMDVPMVEPAADNAVPMLVEQEAAVEKIAKEENASKGKEQQNMALNKGKKVEGDNNERFKVADKRAFAFEKKKELMDDEDVAKRRIAPVRYHRARVFSAPVYDKQENVETRTDFRNTVYWNPDVEVDRTGRKTLEFYNSDDVTSFRVTAEGIGKDGSVGRVERNYFTQLPFAMSVKAPVETATGDKVMIPLTLKNNTDKPLGGNLTITSPESLQALRMPAETQTIMPGEAKTIYLEYVVADKTGEGELKVKFSSCGLSDAFAQKIKTVPQGFPVAASFSAQDHEKTFNVSINNLVKGSIQATLTAYPSVVSDLMKGVEGILREPYGCFEQTSTSSYPNAMILDYLKTTDNKDEKLMAKATALLDKGYKRLITFETKEKGYEWFGSNPGHEALTAYGLMQFVDMKEAGGEIDEKMIARTAQWLMARKDGKGGFNRNDRALDHFGRASKEVTDAYIIYALSEAGFNDINKEFNQSYQAAKSLKDAYLLALVANAAYNLKKIKEGDEVMKMLMGMQSEKGLWTTATHSITYSTGQSLNIETTSLAIMAIIKSSSKHMAELTKAAQALVSERNGYGTFGNTQGTILALKALTEFAKFYKKTSEEGTIEVYVDGKKVGEKSYKAGDKGAIVMDGLEKHLSAGNHDIKVKYPNVKDPLPYSLAVSWNTFLPASQQECVIDLKTTIANQEVKVGETVRFTATLKNKKAEGIPSTMAIIGIPAGLSVQPWQLKELQEKKVFDYYEINGNNVALYYRCMAPSDVKTINLDLKADIPGEYNAPASSGYLYYTNEFKNWSAVDKIKINKA